MSVKAFIHYVRTKRSRPSGRQHVLIHRNPIVNKTRYNGQYKLRIKNSLISRATLFISGVKSSPCCPYVHITDLGIREAGIIFIFSEYGYEKNNRFLSTDKLTETC